MAPNPSPSPAPPINTTRGRSTHRNRRSRRRVHIPSASPARSASPDAQPNETPDQRRIRRRVNETETDLHNLPRTKKQRAWATNFVGKYIAEIETYGRVIPRNISVFNDLREVFQDGLLSIGLWAAAEDDDELAGPNDEAREAQQLQKKLNINTFSKIMEHPGIASLIRMLGSREESIATIDLLADTMKRASYGAQGDDRKKLKKDILTLIFPNAYAVNFNGPPPLRKCDRGFNNAVTAKLICPLRYLERYHDDAEAFRTRISSGALLVEACDYPAFLYPEGTRYNPDDLEAGLLKGETYRHIFHGNGFEGLEEKSSSRPTVAEINDIKAVTPRQIAYTAIQARHALSSAPSWKMRDSAFHYPTFYNSIVKLFEDDPDDEWVIETLAWWNEKAFGSTANQVPDCNRPMLPIREDSDIADISPQHCPEQ